jgi:hypothetical protein
MWGHRGELCISKCSTWRVPAHAAWSPVRGRSRLLQQRYGQRRLDGGLAGSGLLGGYDSALLTWAQAVFFWSRDCSGAPTFSSKGHTGGMEGKRLFEELFVTVTHLQSALCPLHCQQRPSASTAPRAPLPRIRQVCT